MGSRYRSGTAEKNPKPCVKMKLPVDKYENTGVFCDCMKKN